MARHYKGNKNWLTMNTENLYKAGISEAKSNLSSKHDYGPKQRCMFQSIPASVDIGQSDSSILKCRYLIGPI